MGNVEAENSELSLRAIVCMRSSASRLCITEPLNPSEPSRIHVPRDEGHGFAANWLSIQSRRLHEASTVTPTNAIPPIE